MDLTVERVALMERLDRCRELARAYPSGPTAEMLHDMVEELGDRIRSLDELASVPLVPDKVSDRNTK
jgi:hypothetical protein